MPSFFLPPDASFWPGQCKALPPNLLCFSKTTSFCVSSGQSFSPPRSSSIHTFHDAPTPIAATASIPIRKGFAADPNSTSILPFHGSFYAQLRTLSGAPKPLAGDRKPTTKGLAACFLMFLLAARRVLLFLVAVAAIPLLVLPAQADNVCGPYSSSGVFWVRNVSAAVLVAPRYSNGQDGSGGDSRTDCVFAHDIKVSLWHVLSSSLPIGWPPAVVPIPVTINGVFFTGSKLLLDVFLNATESEAPVTSYTQEQLAFRPLTVLIANNLFESNPTPECLQCRVELSVGILPVGSNITIVNNTIRSICSRSAAEMLSDQHALYLLVGLMGRSAEDRSYLYVHRNDVTAHFDAMSSTKAFNITGIMALASGFSNAVWDISFNNVSMRVAQFPSVQLIAIGCIACQSANALFVARGNNVSVVGERIVKWAGFGGIALIQSTLSDVTLALFENNTASVFITNAMMSAGEMASTGLYGFQRLTMTNGSKAMMIDNTATVHLEHQKAVSGGMYTLAETKLTEPLGVGSSILQVATAEYVWRSYLEKVHGGDSGEAETSSFIAYLDSPSAHPLSASASIIVCGNVGDIDGANLIGGVVSGIGGAGYVFSSVNRDISDPSQPPLGGDYVDAARPFILIYRNEVSLSVLGGGLLMLAVGYVDPFAASLAQTTLSSISSFATVIANNTVSVAFGGAQSIAVGICPMGF